jgi:hypothetical protein
MLLSFDMALQDIYGLIVNVSRPRFQFNFNVDANDLFLCSFISCYFAGCVLLPSVRFNDADAYAVFCCCRSEIQFHWDVENYHEVSRNKSIVGLVAC